MKKIRKYPLYMGIFIGYFTIILFLLRGYFFSSSFPLAYDIFGHLAKVEFISSSIMEKGQFPNWFPGWYNGHPILHYYPPLSVWVLVIINLFVRNVFLSYHIFLFFLLIFSAGMVFKVARLMKMSLEASFLAGLFYIFSPLTLQTIFWDGNVARLLTLFLQPLFFFLVIRRENKPNKDFFALVLTSALLLLAHIMQAAIIFIMGAIYTLFFMWKKERIISIRKSIKLLSPIFIGILICSWWFIPAMTNYELINAPHLAKEKVELFSVSREIFDFSLRDKRLDRYYLGIFLLGLFICATFFAKRKKEKSFFIAGIISLCFSFGPSFPLYILLPMWNKLLPDRFLSFSIFAMALGGSSLLDLFDNGKSFKLIKKGLFLIFLFGVFLFDTFPYLKASNKAYYDFKSEVQLSKKLADYEGKGRVDIPIESRAAFQYFPLFVSGKENSSGYQIEGTPLYKDRININRAFQKGIFEYISKKYNQWNVQYLILDLPMLASMTEKESGLEDYKKFLIKQNWQVHSEREQIETWEKNNGQVLLSRPNAPDGFFQTIDRDQSLVIGHNASQMVLAHPFLTEGISPFLTDYQDEYLDLFSQIVLMDFGIKHDLEEEERKALSLLDHDKDLLVSLDSLEGLNQNSQVDFLGVTLVPLELTVDDEIRVNLLNISSKQNITERTFALKGVTSWQTFGYQGLDQIILSVNKKDRQIPLLGYKNINGKKVCFLGGNLFYYAFLNEDQEMATFLTNYLNSDGQKRVHFAQLEAFSKDNFADFVSNFQKDDEKISFSYQSQKTYSILLSMTYSPHWKAYLDGKEITIFNHENLQMLNLPSGEHFVLLRYENIPLHFWSQIISLITLLVGIIIGKKYSNNQRILKNRLPSK